MDKVTVVTLNGTVLYAFASWEAAEEYVRLVYGEWHRSSSGTRMRNGEHWVNLWNTLEGDKYHTLTIWEGPVRSEAFGSR